MIIRHPESELAVRTIKHKLEPTAGTGVAAATEPQTHGTHKTLFAKEVRKLSMSSSVLVKPAIVDSLHKLSPRTQAKNPVTFVVYVDSVFTTILWMVALYGQVEAPAGLVLAVSMWLWFTVSFANFVEVLAKGHSKQQTASLCGIKAMMQAKVLAGAGRRNRAEARVVATLRRGDIMLIEAGDMVSGDGGVIKGMASADKSAITGESAPVIRESDGDFSSVTGGTRVFSDQIIMCATANLGESLLGWTISMMEGAKHQKTPNKLALAILLVSLTIILMLAIVTLLPYSIFSVEAMKVGSPITATVLVVSLVYLIPTTIGGLLSATGVAGVSRIMQANVIAISGHAVEAAGDVGMLLLDKTGTITHNSRQVLRLTPAPGVTTKQLVEAA